MDMNIDMSTMADMIIVYSFSAAVGVAAALLLVRIIDAVREDIILPHRARKKARQEREMRRLMRRMHREADGNAAILIADIEPMGDAERMPARGSDEQ